MADACTRYLASYQMLENEAGRIRLRLEDTKDRIMRVTALYGDQPRGGGGSDRNDRLALLADMESDLITAYLDAFKKAHEIEEFIQRVDPGPNNIYRLILSMRFLDGHSWDVIREQLKRYGCPCETRTMYNWYGKALNAARIVYAETHPDARPEEVEDE